MKKGADTRAETVLLQEHVVPFIFDLCKMFIQKSISVNSCL